MKRKRERTIREEDSQRRAAQTKATEAIERTREERKDGVRKTEKRRKNGDGVSHYCALTPQQSHFETSAPSPMTGTDSIPVSFFCGCRLGRAVFSVLIASVN